MPPSRHRCKQTQAQTLGAGGGSPSRTRGEAGAGLSQHRVVGVGLGLGVSDRLGGVGGGATRRHNIKHTYSYIGDTDRAARNDPPPMRFWGCSRAAARPGGNRSSSTGQRSRPIPRVYTHNHTNNNKHTQPHICKHNSTSTPVCNLVHCLGYYTVCEPLPATVAAAGWTQMAGNCSNRQLLKVRGQLTC